MRNSMARKELGNGYIDHQVRIEVKRPFTFGNPVQYSLSRTIQPCCVATAYHLVTCSFIVQAYNLQLVPAGASHARHQVDTRKARA